MRITEVGMLRRLLQPTQQFPDCNELCRLRNNKPPDRNRGEQLKTQACKAVVLRQAQDIQKDGIFIYPTAILVYIFVL